MNDYRLMTDKNKINFMNYYETLFFIALLDFLKSNFQYISLQIIVLLFHY